MLYISKTSLCVSLSIRCLLCLCGMMGTGMCLLDMLFQSLCNIAIFFGVNCYSVPIYHYL